KEYEEQAARGEEPWAPFASYQEWEFAHWLIKSGMSQTEMSKFFKLQWNQPESQSFSFSSTKTFLEKIDSLPTGPKFERKEIVLTGDIVDESGERASEVLELWYRNPVECVQELLGNPLFKDYLHYAP
ncbi:hypothetical protein M407DRAFT_51392, partial [Tulasnella calospora MUT 4182]